MTLSPTRELPATESLILGLDEYIRARYGLLAVQTFEEALRVLRANGGDPVQKVGPDAKAA